MGTKGGPSLDNQQNRGDGLAVGAAGRSLGLDL